MGIDSLLEMVDQYVDARRQVDMNPAPSCSDWDCGLAIEFEPPGSPEDRQKLERARSRLERALNEYIDSRIRAFLENREDPKDPTSMKT